MSAPNPRKWFPGSVASISFKKVDKWAERQREYKPYFDSWAEAHEFMLARAVRLAANAKRALKSAERHLASVKKMHAPDLDAPAKPESERQRAATTLDSMNRNKS